MAGRSCASVLLVARLTTASRSSGGKAPGPTGAGGVLQAGEAGGDEALAPLADGVPVAVQLRGDLLVVGAVGVGSAQEEPAAEGQGLRGGAGAGEGLELLAEFVGEHDWGTEGAWPVQPPCG